MTARQSHPIVLTALLGDADFAWLDALRRRHYPTERNRVPAHLTLFHHLPPSVADELARRLRVATRGTPPPRARLAGVLSLGRGVAFRVESEELERLRAELADAFAGLLTPQDQAGWRPHVTIQNKADPAVAKALARELNTDFRPKPLAIAGLASWFYRDGPWEPIARHKFT